MRQNKPSINHFPGADWQILGVLELPVGSNVDDKININLLLMEILKPLKLQVDFRNKILTSAQDAIALAIQDVAVKETEPVRLLIFAPADYKSSRQIWGFFRIGKSGYSIVDGNPFNHSIEFYLYLENK